MKNIIIISIIFFLAACNQAPETKNAPLLPSMSSHIDGAYKSERPPFYTHVFKSTGASEGVLSLMIREGNFGNFKYKIEGKNIILDNGRTLIINDDGSINGGSGAGKLVKE